MLVKKLILIKPDINTVQLSDTNSIDIGLQISKLNAFLALII